MVASEETRPTRAHALTCLRLYNVQQVENETSEDCFLKIKEIIKEAALDIPDPVIDRAHRVGTAYNNKPPAMIVKFTTSRHRTKLYRARKEIKEKFGYSLQVDLAKEHLYILKKVREMGRQHKEKSGFEFAYANVNCVLFMKINGRFERFTTVEEARKLMGLTSEPDVNDDADDDHEVTADGEDNQNNQDAVIVESRAPVTMVSDGSSETSSNDSHESVDDSYYGDDECTDSNEFIMPASQPIQLVPQMQAMHLVQPMQPMQQMQSLQPIQHLQLVQPVQLLQQPAGRLPVIQEVIHEHYDDNVVPVGSYAEKFGVGKYANNNVMFHNKDSGSTKESVVGCVEGRVISGIDVISSDDADSGVSVACEVESDVAYEGDNSEEALNLNGENNIEVVLKESYVDNAVAGGDQIDNVSYCNDVSQDDGEIPDVADVVDDTSGV